MRDWPLLVRAVNREPGEAEGSHAGRGVALLLAREARVGIHGAQVPGGIEEGEGALHCGVGGDTELVLKPPTVVAPDTTVGGLRTSSVSRTARPCLTRSIA